MSSYLVLDTDVSSRSIKRQLPAALSAKLTGRIWCITFVTVGELWQWADTRNWGPPARTRLEHWLERVLVIDSDETVARTWGHLGARAAARGRRRPANDSWIAACCLARNLPLATLNIKDFTDYVDHEGLQLIG